MRLKGKKTIVTGAGRGIGLAIAEALDREGAHVLIVDIHEENAKKAASQLTNGKHLVADVAEVEQADDTIAQAVDILGGLDVLVNNAGVQLPKGSLFDLDPEKWDKTQAVNVRGTFFLSKAAAKVMKEQRYGRIINVCSIAGRVFWLDNLPYDVSKGGVTSLTGAMALELAPFNITVNGIAPGYVNTELNARTFASKPDILEEITAKIPMGRIAPPAEMAGAVVFLASDDASYITGHIITIDGGYTLS